MADNNNELGKELVLIIPNSSSLVAVYDYDNSVNCI